MNKKTHDYPSTRKRSKHRLKFGRQAQDVRDIITSVRSGDVVTAVMVYDMFNADTVRDWSAAYGFGGVGKVQHVLTNIAGGNTKGPRLKKKGMFFEYEPVEVAEPAAVDAFQAHAVMAEAAASVALDGETYSIEDADLIEPPPISRVPDKYRLIGEDLDGNELYFNEVSLEVGILTFEAIT